jgi:TonB dependent receptor-like, beta-barrel/Carboxypeptidase regulatory-like domain
MIRILGWCGVGVVICATASPALAQRAVTSPVSPVRQVAAARHGELHGFVQDEKGLPLSGAIVSALGSTSAFAISDRDGRFTFRDLPAGPYLVRAHLQAYVPSRGRIIQISPDARNTSTIELTRRLEATDPPPVVAAAIAPVETPVEPSQTEHSHDEVAWRMRHAKRSVLKDGDEAIAQLGAGGSVSGESIGGLGHAVGTSARLASSLFDDLPPVTGQFNLLTTTSFDRPQDLFSMNVEVPKSIAFLSLAAPGAQGDWTMRGTITQGDLASWILAGSYARHSSEAHAYEAGLSYGMQRYLGGNGEALAAIRDGSRNVGAMYAFDNWTVTRQIRLGYGAKYARYDYLTDRGLWSPRASIAVQPSTRDSFTVHASMSRREVAPGAEEFLPPSIGLWLPPERTFAPVAHGTFRPERHDQIEVGVERTWPGAVVLGVRVFEQRVDDQMVTLFGIADAPFGASGIGHYEVGSAGSYDARGWGVSVSRSVSDRLRASVDYSQADAIWTRRSPDFAALAALASSVLRDEDRVHDLTASVESVVPSTSTRVFVIYKLNAALAASEAMPALAGARPRFDVQVNQALPFLNFTNAQWEMLVAVTNLFKEELGETSIYDEALVVRPPKRVLGGVTLKF